MAPAGGKLMQPVLAAPWRLRLRDSGQRQVLGAGFLITGRLALTCAHVIEGRQPSEIWADLGGSAARSARARPCAAAGPKAAAADVAVLQLDPSADDVPSAPLGAAAPPPPGTSLLAFGFPALPASSGRRSSSDYEADSPGFWAQVVVDGFSMQAGQVQLTSQAAHGMPVRHRFSGGPVVDPETGLVVGMIAQTWEAQRLAFMIPVRTLAEACPGLQTILLPRASADPKFVHAIAALNSGNYPAALECFSALCDQHPDDPDTWYYLALAAGGGKRPRAHSTSYVREIGQLLQEGAALSPREPHVLALWALLKEDHHRARGISEGTPPLAELRRAVADVSAEHAAEICRHFPAPEAVIWRELSQRRSR